MSVTNVDLGLYDWSTATHRFSVKDASGALQSLSGYTAVMQVRDTHGGSLLMTLTEGSGVTTDAAGHVDVTFDGATIGPATWTTAVYDLFLLRTADGKRFAVATGSLFITPSVANFA